VALVALVVKSGYFCPVISPCNVTTMNDEDEKLREGFRKIDGKMHSTVPEPEIEVNLEKIREAFKEARKKHTTKVRKTTLP